MPTTPLLELYDQEMRVAMAYPDARREQLPHVVRFLRPAPAMNFILYHQLEEGEMDAVIQAQIADLAPLGQPFTWKLYDHDRPIALRERLLAHGFEEDPEPGAIMVLDLQKAPLPPVSPEADIRRIEQASGIEDVIAVEEQVWGGSFAWMRQRLGAHLQHPGYLSLYVAYVDDVPAASAWSYFHENSHFASLWGGSTVPAYRRRGLYSALLATRMAEATDRGVPYLVIEAGEMSGPIVARHGFELLTTVRDFEWKGGGGG